MSKDDKDGKDDKKRPNHSGSIVAEDDELTLWLNRLWARKEPPERVEVWQMFGRNRNVRGEMIHHEDFKHGETLDIEQANKLANEIMMAVQNDCDSLRRESSYQLAVIDRNRKASPLIRRIGPIQPKRSYAITKAGEEFEDEDDDSPRDAKAIELKYVQEGLEQARWDKQRYDRVMGEMLILQNSIIQNQQQVLDKMFNQQISFFEKVQEAQDRALDREVIREKEKFKIGLWKDGMRTARNLLPGLFGGGEGGNGAGRTEAIAHISGANGTNGTNGHATVKDYGPSQERTLVDNFLTDCEDDEKLEVALFGDFEEQNGKLAQTQPGIFTIAQYHILIGVREGRIPADALDQLMPQSGHKNEITQEQIKKAIEAGVTDGIGSAIFELVALRQRRRDALEADSTQEERPE